MMKRISSVMAVLVLVLLLSACSKKGTSGEWIPEDLAGIENPGFTIITKEEGKDSITFELEEADLELITQFISELQYNSEFNINVNYVYDQNSYSYAAFNKEGESIHLAYNVASLEGVFTYAKSGSDVFVPGIRDMGYSVNVSYDYKSNLDYTMYLASLFYGISPNVMFSDSGEYLISFELTDFEIKTSSTYGTLYFADSLYSGAEEDYSLSGTSIYEMSFYVIQDNVGQYDVETPYGTTAEFFDVMDIEQDELDFTISFTAFVTTNAGSYSYEYEMSFMPEGYDVTVMDRTLFVENYIETFDKATPFLKVD